VFDPGGLIRPDLLLVRIRVNRSRARDVPVSHDGSALAFGTLFSSQGASSPGWPASSDSFGQQEGRRLTGRQPRRIRSPSIGYVRRTPPCLPLSERWLPSGALPPEPPRERPLWYGRRKGTSTRGSTARTRSSPA